MVDIRALHKERTAGESRGVTKCAIVFLADCDGAYYLLDVHMGLCPLDEAEAKAGPRLYKEVS